jgi:hypothetical protein
MRTCLVVVLGALVAGCGSSDSSSPADKVDADLYAADLDIDLDGPSVFARFRF